MKKIRLAALLFAFFLIAAILTVSPAGAFDGTLHPRTQSGVTLKASGEAWTTTGAKISISFDFDPAGGPVSGEYEGWLTQTDQGITINYHTYGTIAGTFSGGDGGELLAAGSGETVMTSGGSSTTQAFTTSWEGRLYADGSGRGTVVDNMGMSDEWEVTFDARAFQAALEPVPNMAEAPTPDLYVTEVVNIWPPSIEQLVKSWPELDPAIAEILDQDGAILVRDENGVFYAVDNQGNRMALPPDMQSVLQMNNEFGMLQNANLLSASPAVQAFVAAGGSKDAITGEGTYQYFTIPEWLKQRQYLKVTMKCSGGYCTPVATYSVVHSSLWQPTLASSEHASIRGTINGGGDFIFAPFPHDGVELAALSFVPIHLQTAGARPYLGVQVTQVTDRAIIELVQDGSPAGDAGLQVNDAIVSVNGIYIDEQNTLAALIGQYPGGTQVELGILLGGSDFTDIYVTLASLNPQMTITPSAEIYTTENTEMVVDIGLNGVTGVLVLADWAHVSDPVSGSGVDVPAGSAVIVVPGYEIGSPIPVSSSDANVWWAGGQPLPTPVPGPLNLPENTILFALIAICFCVVVIVVVVVVVVLVTRRRKRPQPYQQYPGGMR